MARDFPAFLERFIYIDPRQLVAAAYQHLYGPQGNQVAAQAAYRGNMDAIGRSTEAATFGGY